MPVFLQGCLPAFAKEKLTIGAASTALTATVYRKQIGSGEFLDRLTATRATITLETNPIRFWLTGDAPTTTDGHLLAVGDVLNLESQDQIEKFRGIPTGSNATVQVTYFGA